MPELLAKTVVLGAGAMGAATAYHLARRGEPVVLVEQFAIGHHRGSSHGAARITRHSYAEPAYASLMPAAFDAWRRLEADAGEPFYLRTGGVTASPARTGYIDRIVANLEAIHVPHRRMTGSEWNKRSPIFGVPDAVEVVFEPDAGMLAAGRIVLAEVALAKALGGDQTTVLEDCPVRQIDLDADKPTLLTDSGPIVADRLIVTAGAWLPGLLPEFAQTLRPTRQQVLYFAPPDPIAYTPGRMPVFIYQGESPLDAFYGMPAHDGLGVKVARHGGPETNPDQPDSVVGEPYRATVRAFLRQFLPALAEAPIGLTEVCLYTMSPDEGFRVGPLPGRPDVLVASPCSGHGFKFSCLIGRVLADLATRGTTEIPPGAWQLGNTESA